MLSSSSHVVCTSKYWLRLSHSKARCIDSSNSTREHICQSNYFWRFWRVSRVWWKWAHLKEWRESCSSSTDTKGLINNPLYTLCFFHKCFSSWIFSGHCFQAHGYRILGMIGDGATDLEVRMHLISLNLYFFLVHLMLS